MILKGPMYSALPASDQRSLNVKSYGYERVIKIAGKILVAAAFEA